MLATATMFLFLLALPRPSPAAPPERPWFTEVAAESGLGGISVQNALWADLDGDGYADCVTAGGSGIKVFMSTGTGAGRIFRDFTEESGINRDPDVSTGTRRASFVVAGDADNDGDPDLFSGLYCEFEKPRTDPKTGEILKDAGGRPLYEKADYGLRSEILLNDGSGHFAVPAAGRRRANSPPPTAIPASPTNRRFTSGSARPARHRWKCFGRPGRPSSRTSLRTASSG